MRVIVYLGVVALMAAIGAHFGGEYYGDTGPMVGALLGGIFGLLVVSGLRVASPGK